MERCAERTEQRCHTSMKGQMDRGVRERCLGCEKPAGETISEGTHHGWTSEKAKPDGETQNQKKHFSPHLLSSIVSLETFTF